MPIKIARLGPDRRAVTAVEAALLLPVLILAIIGIAQMGILYFAHSGLRHLVGEGARYASISPRPSDAAIKSRLKQGSYGLVNERLEPPLISYGKDGEADFADIEVSYTVQLDFVFWRPDPVRLSERRRVFLYSLPKA